GSCFRCLRFQRRGGRAALRLPVLIRVRLLRVDRRLRLSTKSTVPLFLCSPVPLFQARGCRESLARIPRGSREFVHSRWWGRESVACSACRCADVSPSCRSPDSHGPRRCSERFGQLRTASGDLRTPSRGSREDLAKG